MEVRKLILATVLGLAVMMFLSGLWHGLGMRGFHATHSLTLREVPLLRIIGLGYFLLGVLMAVIYPKGYEGGFPWLEGVCFGMFMGLPLCPAVSFSTAPRAATPDSSSLTPPGTWCSRGRRSRHRPRARRQRR